MTVPDYPDFQTPQAHATAISVTGVPLLTLAGTLLTAQNFMIAGGGNVSTAALPITQLGYEIQLKLQVPAAATVPFVDCVMTWTDNTGNNTVAVERWMLPCGSAANYIFTGTGPTKGSQLTLKLINEDPAQTATVNVVILTNSRIYRRDRWIPNLTQNVPGFTIAQGDATRALLANGSGINVNAGATLTRLFPTYHGDVMFYVEQVGVSGANSQAKLQTEPFAALSNADIYSSAPSGGVGSGITTLTRFPRAPLLFSFVNGGTVAASVTFQAVMLDDKQ